MLYRVTADLAVLIHFLWIVFLICGAFIGRRYRVLRGVHIAGLGFAIVIQLCGWYCPLTYLEIWLRERHDPSLTYNGSFIIHYVEKIVYIDLSPSVIFMLTLFLIFVSAYLYFKRVD